MICNAFAAYGFAIRSTLKTAKYARNFRKCCTFAVEIVKAMERRFIFYIILALHISLLSCQPNRMMRQLAEIDSIASKQGDQQALDMLDKIIPEAIDDEESLAYYWLLKIRAEIHLQKGIKTTAPLDKCISYYKKTHDNERLVRAYGYKALILESAGDLKNASLALKEAENIVDNDPKMTHMSYYIYNSLADINYRAHEKGLALKYNKLALKAAYQLHNQRSIAYALMGISISYDDGGQHDSALYYLSQLNSYIEYIPNKQKNAFYNNIGLSMIDRDIVNAEKYLMLAYDISPNAYTYKGLARIYYKRGEKEKAREMWQQALKTDNLYLRAEVLQAMYESQRDEEDYKTASETAMLIAALKDSIAQKERTDNIRGLQEQFDQEQRRLRDRAKSDAIIYGVVALLLLAIALTLYFYTRNAKGKERLAKTQQQLEQYRNRLIVMEKEGKTDTKEVEQLTQKIAELQAKQGALLQNGRERFEEAMAGGTTIRWNRNDFSDCIEYYRTQDAAFVAHMETNYRHLSSKYMFFALMEHLGHTDEELQHLMAISQSTVRSYRSRINSAVIKTE